MVQSDWKLWTRIKHEPTFTSHPVTAHKQQSSRAAIKNNFSKLQLTKLIRDAIVYLLSMTIFFIVSVFQIVSKFNIVGRSTALIANSMVYLHTTIKSNQSTQTHTLGWFSSQKWFLSLILYSSRLLFFFFH